MSGKYHPQQANLLWDTALGFIGFITALALLQAIMNVFAEEPAIWPGFVAAGFVFGTWMIYRGKKKYFRHTYPEDTDNL